MGQEDTVMTPPVTLTRSLNDVRPVVLTLFESRDANG